MSPKVEFAFLSFAVGIFSRIETALWIRHNSLDVLKNFFCCPLIFLLFRRFVSLNVSQANRGLIIEHLLKMWNAPGGVSRVPVKTKANLIVDAPEPHFLQCFLNISRAFGVPF